MKNACKIFLFSILLVAAVSAGSYISQFISHQPVDFTNPNEFALGYNVRTVKGYQFLITSDNFHGIVLSVENLGEVQGNAVWLTNFGKKLRIVIKSLDGDVLIVDDFTSGKHAEDEIESMVGQEFLFPDKLWRMRATVGID